jgi:hypothetical protein
MGPTPAKVGRIKARDTQTTSPDPWSIRAYSTGMMDLGSVIIDCGDKHYNKGVTLGYLYV